ncbi:hypothetical protein HZH66_004151 [Vespula vulgaris]|uniref:Uncharacterized protein n=1 Tax=Vespula vulgaris TaxID=7454 RepID=A0A834NDR8_VESVU|nr:hypothetical protein HZH66_004151 [Vespula vulgaris]
MSMVMVLVVGGSDGSDGGDGGGVSDNNAFPWATANHRRLRGLAFEPCGEIRCGEVRYDAVRCGAMRCDAMRCDAMQCGAVQRTHAFVVNLHGTLTWKFSKEIIDVPTI